MKTNSKRSITVAVIDSGININVADLHKYVQQSCGFIINGEGQIKEQLTKQIKSEHGTAVSLIIRSVCEDVRFIDINILDDDLTTDGRIFLQAFRKAVDLSPNIIHLSLGTTRFIYKFALQRLVNAARKKNTMVIAAAHNQGLRCYPANLKGVVLVKVNDDLKPCIRSDRRGVFYAPSYLLDIPGTNELRNPKISGTSLSAAYVTGTFAKKLSNISFD